LLRKNIAKKAIRGEVMKPRVTLALIASTLFIVLGGAPTVQAQAQEPVAKWSFDESDGATARESVTGVDDKITGIFKHVPGVSGGALRFDGDTTGMVHPSAAAPKLTSAFSIESWIAINTYSWNWIPIVDQRKGEEAGYLFGIDSFGHLGLQLAANGHWESLTSTVQIPLKKWTHVAASFDSARGLAIYLDGKLAGELLAPGMMIPASDQDLLIGRVREAVVPAQWIHPKYPVWYSFDGIIDQLEIYNRSLTPKEIATEYSAAHPPSGEVLPYPALPSGPSGPGAFGAYYATLKYDELWDAPRRVGPDSDVVVRFDNSPIRLVFWQGTNYIPAWVTENGKWYSDEFVETWGAGCPDGADCEPMSDKQNRYAHVRIIESTAARAVVHFRYGLCEVEHYICANIDPYTGWADWGDEYYTVYPDGVAVREQVAWTSNFSDQHGKPGHEFQETMILNPPGTRPEDNIANDALLLENMKGETFTYSWVPESPAKLDRPQDANIQVVNLKSSWKPFQIVSPGNVLLKPYRTKERTYSIFEWWNHWPVAQVQSSGISAVAADKPSSSSLSHIEGQPYAQTSDSITKLLLDGLTTKPPADLLPLAKSWIAPPAMKIAGGPFQSEGYDPAQRAYVVTAGSAGKFHASFEASADSPLVNPAIVIKNWGDQVPRLKVNGKAVSWGPDYRVGQVHTLEGTNLVLWMKLQSTSPTTVDLIPAGGN
jgi:hypothetical protein